MLNAYIKIGSIDYENTMCNIYPLLSEKIASRKSKNLIVRLLQQLGDTAVPVLNDLMLRLPEDTKNEILISSVNAYSSELKEKVNKEFKKDKWGQFFEIGTILMIRRKYIILEIGSVMVDYRELLKSEDVGSKIEGKLGVLAHPVRSIANMAAFVAPDTIEKMGLELLLRDENKSRLMNLLRNVLNRYGIKIGVDEIKIKQADTVRDEPGDKHRQFIMSEKTEDDIITALAGYLKDSAVKNSAV